MKIFLSGANGMVGTELLRSLAKSGLEVLATGRGIFRHNIQIINNLIRYERIDLTDHALLERSFATYRPSHIIHLAAITQVDDCELNKDLCYSINVDTTAVIIRLAKQYNTKVIYLSTDFVFDGKFGPYRETDQLGPVNHYGTTKMTSERLLLESGLDHCIIRTVLLYGCSVDSSRSSFIHWVRENLEKRNPIKVVNDQVRTPTYIPDLVNGILRILELNSSGIYHISGGECMTPYEMSIKVAEELGLDQTLIQAVNASSFRQPAQRPLKTGFIIEKAKKDLGYTPTPFGQALKEIFKC